MAKKQKSKSAPAPKKTLVRAANGDLYVVTQTTIVKLDMAPNQTGDRIQDLLEQVSHDVTGIIDEDIPTLATGVLVSCPEIFGHD